MRNRLILLLSLLPGTALAQAAAEGEVFLFQEVHQRPRLLPGSVLYYPATDSAGGRVTATVVVDSTGKIAPHTIQIAKSPSAAFTAAARATLLSQTYRPGKVSGHLVRVLMQQDLRFRRGAVTCPEPVVFEGVSLCADSTTGK